MHVKGPRCLPNSLKTLGHCFPVTTHCIPNFLCAVKSLPCVEVSLLYAQSVFSLISPSALESDPSPRIRTVRRVKNPLLSSEPFGGLRFQRLIGPSSRHCLWNHYVQIDTSSLDHNRRTAHMQHARASESQGFFSRQNRKGVSSPKKRTLSVFWCPETAE